jgi:hypothetical protein
MKVLILTVMGMLSVLKAVFRHQAWMLSMSDNMLSVSLLTTFAGKGDNHLFDSLTNGAGIGYGDLFLSISWTPYGTAPYSGDDVYTGTAWTYWLCAGRSLDGRKHSRNRHALLLARISHQAAV